MSVQILIVDDQVSVRNGIRSLLSTRPDWNICGEASDGLEAIEKAKTLDPDLILMDVSMPRMNGLEATRILRRELPESRVVIVSQNDPMSGWRSGSRSRGFSARCETRAFRDFIACVGGSHFPLHFQNDPVAASTPPSHAPAHSMPDWLKGSGALGRLIAEHDWAQTPLGPIDNWPQSLQTAVNLILNSQHPMWIGWGTASHLPVQRGLRPGPGLCQASLGFGTSRCRSLVGDLEYLWASGRKSFQVRPGIFCRRSALVHEPRRFL